jgi:hypothetical protein
MIRKEKGNYFDYFRLAPQVTIVDGKIVLNEESLYVRHTSNLSADDVIHDVDPHITSATYVTRESSDKWNHEETEKFYKVNPKRENSSFFFYSFSLF